jgi:hypothetical protein
MFLILYTRRETPDPFPTSKSETACYHMYCLPWETWVESKKKYLGKFHLDLRLMVLRTPSKLLIIVIRLVAVGVYRLHLLYEL